MKSNIHFKVPVFSLMLTLMLYGCEPENSKVPILETSAVSSVTESSAICGGTITSDNGLSVTEKGVCWAISANPDIVKDFKTLDGAGGGGYSSIISGLKGGTDYFVRAYATNSAGTGYGMTLAFKTLGTLPKASTLVPSEINNTSVMLNGEVNANLLQTTVNFDYGTTLTYGKSIAASPNILVGNLDTEVTGFLSGLSAGTTYHFRVKAENSLGIVYGDDIVFSTPTGVIDIVGNVYSTIQIGTQIWMRENLKTTKYNDGTIITYIPDSLSWNKDNYSEGYCYYNYDEVTYRDTYGALYNWNAVNTQKLCPDGWHVPTDQEWKILEMYLGMGEAEANNDGWRTYNTVGNKLKETGSIHWIEDNSLATNESGFTALPAGKGRDGDFWDIGKATTFWTSTLAEFDAGWVRRLLYTMKGVQRTQGFPSEVHSVRCIKN